MKKKSLKTRVENSIQKNYGNEIKEIQKAKHSFGQITPVTAYSSMSICLTSIACSTAVLILDIVNHNIGSAILFGIVTLILIVLLFLLCLKDKDELVREMNNKIEKPSNSKKHVLSYQAKDKNEEENSEELGEG